MNEMVGAGIGLMIGHLIVAIISKDFTLMPNFVVVSIVLVVVGFHVKHWRDTR